MKLSIRDLLKQAPVVPVIQISDSRTAVPLARALAQGGLKVLEVVLRTPESLAAIRNIIAEVDDVVVGAGTVLNAEHFSSAEEAGCQFVVSPGLTEAMLKTAAQSSMAFLPGVATASDLMRALDSGLDTFKFFPAETSGGAAALKALSGPFQSAKFCPTGGINLNNMQQYLSLNSVLTVGGSWLNPAELVVAEDWAGISELARHTCERVSNSSSTQGAR